MTDLKQGKLYQVIRVDEFDGPLSMWETTEWIKSVGNLAPNAPFMLLSFVVTDDEPAYRSNKRYNLEVFTADNVGWIRFSDNSGFEIVEAVE